MCHETRLRFLVPALTALLGFASTPAAPSHIPKEPAKVLVSVTPEGVRAGGEAHGTLRLVPASGIKINRYPMIKLRVEKQEGLVKPAETAIGNASPPPTDRLEENYYGTVDPVELRVQIDAAATVGPHEIPGQLTYFYCVAASGFCAPAKVKVSIPVTVR